ncbi:MAG: M1 family metallopeptidase [Phycisphaeraceae bacterium]|nr:M1 family metallopeptidase [Phycisphaeraceae bacterium]
MVGVLASCVTRPKGEAETQPVADSAQTPPAAPDRPRGGRGGRGGFSTEFLRAGAPRDESTIFSPLPWRDPNEARLASGAPGPAYWQNRADYVIEATLDAEHRRVTATQTITYTNNSPHSLEYIWINLEQNLFNPSSKGARMTRPRGRFGNRDAFDGGVGVTNVRIDGVGVEPQIVDTVARLDLPQSLKPRGGTVSVSLEFSFDIPPYGSDRLGIEEVEQGTIFELAQWFPSVVKYDDVYGWNHLPYLGAGEFYTDFGSFDVKLTVPRDFIVGATGELQNPEGVLTAEQRERMARASQSRETVVLRSAEEVGEPSSRPEGDGPLTWHFVAHDVRTFAWAASDAFIWDAAAVQGASHATLVQSLYPKEGIEHWSNSTDMLRFAIEGYNARWFEYPYPVAINVNGIVGGMEYPMIIFCRSRSSDRGLYGVTTHEIGHNWFPMVVNTDERRYAWMDEGFNTFINIYSQMERYDEDGPSGRGNPRGTARTMSRPGLQPMMTPPDQMADGRLGFLGYEKPATGLYILREYVLGPERFDFAFRRYIRLWAFKSPRPEDFFRCMEDASGESLTWFWRGWFYETGVLDLAVDEVVEQTGRETESGPGEFTGTVQATFSSRRELVMPLEFKVVYDNGTEEVRRLPVEIWAANTRWTTQWDTGGRHVLEVIVDPDELTPDVDDSNNVWKAPEPEEDAPDGAAGDEA